MNLKLILLILLITIIASSKAASYPHAQFYRPELINFPDYGPSENTSTSLVFPIPSDNLNGCNDISWCNEKCKEVLEEPMIVFCSGYCFCDKVV